MSEWWDSLSGINRAFYCGAVFFSVFFLWQLIAALLGLGDHDTDMDGAGQDAATQADADHPADGDASATVAAFKLLSIRSLITFCTLFFWGAALYLNRGEPIGRAMGISTLWGLAGMASVALLLWMLPRLAHTGTRDMRTCIGARGVVYLDLPANGAGEVRVAVSDVVSYVRARHAAGKALKAGTPVVVKRMLDDTCVEVEETSN
jgi:hypothetical protein